MSKFKTLEEAQAAFDSLKKSYEALQKENANAIKQVEDATKVVAELNEKLEEAKAAEPGIVTATVGKQKYRVNFGVGGKTKEAVAKDQALLKKLIEAGSAAVTAV